MPEKGIYLLTGPVRSGKTTSLVTWSENRNDVQGILTPVINGKRIFMDAASREQFPMEAEGEEETLTVGRFAFSKKNFDKAIRIIRGAAGQADWLLIDEIGPLELSGEGFDAVLKEILAVRNRKLLLVVRDNDDMPEKIKTSYNLPGATCIRSVTAL